MDSHGPMGTGTIYEHFMGIRMGMGWRFMGMEIKVLGIGNGFP
jgi:hypothetical protein